MANYILKLTSHAVWERMSPWKRQADGQLNPNLNWNSQASRPEVSPGLEVDLVQL